MKIQGNFHRTVTVEQVRNGYVTSTLNLIQSIPCAHADFEEMVNELAFQFGLREVDERILLSATKEKQEEYPQNT